jgi:nonsense-mediated mRNA decay protein 3
VDATFVWTEPHSKRIKVKLTIQKEVFGGAILEQVFIVEYVVNHQMCEDCHRVEAKDFWRAVVQVRQKTDHKKTFYYLEQLILKHKAHTNTLNIKNRPDGLDFYFANKQDARKFLDFLLSIVPCRYQTSQQLISHDIHNNTYNYKHTFSLEIVPVCKDDVVCLPAKLAHNLGGISRLLVCTRITNTIHLIDPANAQIAEMSGQSYWRDQFYSVCGPKQLSEYTVMNVDYIMASQNKMFPGQGNLSQKHALADVWVVKSSDLGMTEDYIHTRSHLGYLLKPGDLVMGFDIANTNVNDRNFEQLNTENLPDVIIVKKVFGDKGKRSRKRKWKLQHINPETEGAADTQERDYLDFLEDLEEDPATRQHVNIYRDREKMAVDLDDTDDEDVPRITLQEMLEDMQLDDMEEGASAE